MTSLIDGVLIKKIPIESVQTPCTKEVKTRKSSSKIIKKIQSNKSVTPSSMICKLSQHPSHEMVGKNDVLTLTPIASISSNSNSHSKTYNGNGSFPTKTTSKSFDTVPTPIIQNRYYKHQEEIEVEGGIVIAEDGLLDGSPRRKIQAVACYDGIRSTAAPSSSSSLSSSLAPAPDPSLNPRDRKSVV